MNNLLSYCGLVDAKTRASDKDLPVIYACSSLTNFEYEEYTITGNGRCNPPKFAWKKFVKSHKVNLFLAGF